MLNELNFTLSRTIFLSSCIRLIGVNVIYMYDCHGKVWNQSWLIFFREKRSFDRSSKDNIYRETKNARIKYSEKKEKIEK